MKLMGDGVIIELIKTNTREVIKVNVKNTDNVKEILPQVENNTIKRLLSELLNGNIREFEFNYYKNRVKEFSVNIENNVIIMYSSHNDVLVVIGNTQKYQSIIRIIEQITNVKLSSNFVMVMTKNYMYTRNLNDIKIKRL